MDFLYTLQELRNPVLNGLFSAITYLGSEIVVIGVLCIAYWCLNKQLAYKICFTYFVSGLMVQGTKIACRIDRPWVLDKRLHVLDSAKDAATGYSFPSGHTQSSTGLFSALAFHFKKIGVWIASFVLIALVMFSRMYLGCHTPKDVLVAFAITIVVSFVINRIYGIFEKSSFTRTLTFIMIELISIALIVFTALVVSSGKSTTELAMDCFKAAGAGIGFGIGWYIETGYIKFEPSSSKKLWVEILKFIVGIAGALLLKEGIKIIFGQSIAVNIIRYIIVVIWIVAGYPAIFKKILGK